MVKLGPSPNFANRTKVYKLGINSSCALIDPFFVKTYFLIIEYRICCSLRIWLNIFWGLSKGKKSFHHYVNKTVTLLIYSLIKCYLNSDINTWLNVLQMLLMSKHNLLTYQPIKPWIKKANMRYTITKWEQLSTLYMEYQFEFKVILQTCYSTLTNAFPFSHITSKNVTFSN